LACVHFHHSQDPAPWFAADGCILGIRRGWASCGFLLAIFGPLYKGSVWSMSTNSVKILRAKSAGFSNLRYSRIESTSADCSACLACDIDAEEERATQQAGIPGEVENLD